MTAKFLICLAAANGFIAVGLGAFGAHGLRGRLSEQLFGAYQTAVQYHFYHALALLGVGLLLQRVQVNSGLVTSGCLFMLGILLFSGSLYGLALISPDSSFRAWLGPVTPLGGLCFMLGWLALFVSAYKL